MTRAMARSTAFLFGLGFALLPAVGPFVAILLFVSTQLRPLRSDAIWAGSALLLAISPALHADFGVAAATLLQIAAGWLIYKAFAELAPAERPLPYASAVGVGLLAGLALVIALNLLRVEAWNFASAKTIAQAIVWDSSPALFGHTVLVLGGLIGVMAKRSWVRWSALGLSAVGILLSGSGEAAIGWLIVAVSLAVWGRGTAWRTRLASVGAVVVIVAAAVGLAPALGWGQLGLLLQGTPESADANLLQGTELSFGDWWDDSWVTVTTAEAEIDGVSRTEYVVQKDGAEHWLRLQQAVALEPDTTYTASTWVRTDDPGIEPGIQGWGQVSAAGRLHPFVVAGTLRAGGWEVTSSGPGSILAHGVEAVDGPWARAYITFEYRGDERIPWFVGLVPDNRHVEGSVARFAGFQLETGSLGPYAPGSATRGLGVDVGRRPYWQVAWKGVQERPLLGFGAGTFPSYFLDEQPGRNRLQIVPDHAHNLFLHTWFERGALGLLGVVGLVFAIGAAAALRGDAQLLAVVAAIVLMNLFDTTLLYGGVFYPLVAIAGWRAGRNVPVTTADRVAARRLASRLGLAIADTVGAATALALAVGAATVSAPWLGLEGTTPAMGSGVWYVLLLWPLLSWREGLYPGYGLTPPQELKKQTTVTTYAVLILAAALLFLPVWLPLPLGVLVLMAAAAFVTLPLARALAKRTLVSMDLWGRPVVILGAGATGGRVARALLRTRLDGLQPVAFFDDAPVLQHHRIYGVPVAGTLADANGWAERHGVHHAIVAIPSLHAAVLRDLLDTQGRQFRTVQFIPDLAGMPAESVVASSLDGMLAIEVRNNLAVRRNRFVKRAIDVVCGVALLVLLLPVFLVLGAWIRWDSRGPVLYRSERVGQHGGTFACLKFRTMRRDAEAQLDALIAEDPAIRTEYERFHKLTDDPRVTRAGRFLRAFSLDELPQLLNVLAGSMSLVGPRPYLTREMPSMSELSDVILQAKPGMTGYWQVSERNDVTFADRLEMEAHYVRNWSIWWDIVILVKTAPAMIEKRGK